MERLIRQTLTTALIATWLASVGHALAAPLSAATAKKVAGPTVAMHWGPVQVKIKVQGGTIVDVLATAPTDRSRSAFVNGQALPLLKSEVLKAQSANVSLVAGATLTSRAYLKSLQGAMVKAHL
jgi:uncharacterized protein with FMN-binding domain